MDDIQYHSDIPKSYIFADGGNINEFLTDTMDKFDDCKENRDPFMSDEGMEQLTDAMHPEYQFMDFSEIRNEMINTLQEAVDFDESLLPELETDFPMFAENIPKPVEEVQLQMDIRDPLSKMQQTIEKHLHRNLTDYLICLQGSQLLEGHKNLVEQCVQGEGVVQINVQVQHDIKHINIIDVLKPAEDFVKCPTDKEKLPMKQEVVEKEKRKDRVVQWQVDVNFKKEQERLKIPPDPAEWNDLHVRYWVQWAVRQFNLSQLKLSDWTINGTQLYQLTLADFQKIVPNDPGDVFWTHLELLRQMKLVAVVKKKKDDDGKELSKLSKQTKLNQIKKASSLPTDKYFESGKLIQSSNQFHLWQFLLELLTSKEHKNIIYWLVGTEGEFTLANPAKVAELWGIRKNKPSMTYETMARSLRYYYHTELLSKVQGKRFTYKFVCDLKQLVGYSSAELANLVNYGSSKPVTDD